MKTCPYCAEEIQDKAIVCRFCGRDLPLINSPQEQPVVICPYCLISNPENTIFCLSCGTDIITYQSKSTEAINESSSKTTPITSNISELERSAARMKSYTGIVIFVFCLYIFFFPAGFLINDLYYKEAKKMEEKAGMSLPGVNLLAQMLNISAIAIALAICIAVIAVIYIFS